MIQINNKEITEIYVGLRPIQAVYKGNTLVWENSLLICFSNGYWVDDFPWDDNAYWID